jgi:hypothetical protein
VLTAGTSAHATTLGDIAGFYGENLTALAAHNREVPGIFALNQSVRIPGGPRIRSATVPPGVQAVGGVRRAPDDVPVDPKSPGFARLFLLNAYSLLNYQVAGNPYFRASNLGLPAGPSTQGASPDIADKIRAPKPVQPGDPWDYRQAMPFAKFARPTPPPRGTLAASASSPYLGIGDILQVAFTWQDYYGNTVVTTLSDPQPGDPGPFTEAPMPTGYVDPLVGLGQWPSVSSAWQVLPGTDGGLPTLELLLTFDASRYQGLIVAKASTPTTVTATFTETLDPASAADASNYKVSGATVLTAQLQPDNVSVTRPP